MEDFTFYMDLEKSEGASDDERLVRGLASCEEQDLQKEVILQKGMDVTPCLKSGFVNWDHKSSPEDIIGIPLSIEIAEIANHPVMRKSGLNGVGCYVEAKLFKGHARADAVWSLLKALKGTNRSLAWSVQGTVIERGGPSNNYLTKSVIKHLAITHQPVQTHSFAEIAKSLTSAVAAPIMLENIDAGPLNNYPHVKDLLFGKCLDSHFNKSGQFRFGFRGMLDHLIHCKGESVADSKRLIKECLDKGLISI